MKKKLYFLEGPPSVFGDKNLLLSLSTRRQISFAPHYIIWCFVSPPPPRGQNEEFSSLKIFFFFEMQFLFCQVQLLLAFFFFFFESVSGMIFCLSFFFVNFSHLFCISFGILKKKEVHDHVMINKKCGFHPAWAKLNH
jgi:hypothetical protein